MASLETILHLLEMLAHAYPGVDVSRETLELYVDNLEEIPTRYLKKAVEEHIRLSPYFPRIAELRERAAKISGLFDYTGIED